MSQNQRRQLVVSPLTSTHPDIGRWMWTLENTRRRTDEVLEQIDPASLDWRPDCALHSIGTLLYHIPLVELDWVHVEILGNPWDQPYPDDMMVLFPYPMRTNNALTPVEGISMEEARQRLAIVRQQLLDTFSSMTIEDFRRPRALPESDVTPEWIVQHLNQHEAEHRAEIAALQTQFSKQRDQHGDQL